MSIYKFIFINLINLRRTELITLLYLAFDYDRFDMNSMPNKREKQI